MSDMSGTIIPKSDQLNYDDFLDGKSKTIKVTKVTVKAGEQPVSIFYDGDNGKPWKPCKSMCKVLVYGWGVDSNTYVGRTIVLYGEPKVTWAGLEVGGIRISHMSHVDKGFTMALTASKSNRKPFSVKAFVETVQQKTDAPPDDPKLSKEQQTEVISKLSAAGIESQRFKDAFGVKTTLGELKSSQLEAIDAWISGEKTA